MKFALKFCLKSQKSRKIISRDSPMAKVIFLLLIVYLRSRTSLSKPVEDVSYVEGINFEYKNDKWICGDVECPDNTVGCKIVMKTYNEDRKTIYQTFNCIDKDKNVTLGAGDKIDLVKEKYVDIEIETYIGAKSDYSTRYGSGRYESAKGVIAVDGLSRLKETARQNKMMNEMINAQ